MFQPIVNLDPQLWANREAAAVATEQAVIRGDLQAAAIGAWQFQFANLMIDRALEVN